METLYKVLRLLAQEPGVQESIEGWNRNIVAQNQCSSDQGGPLKCRRLEISREAARVDTFCGGAIADRNRTTAAKSFDVTNL